MPKLRPAYQVSLLVNRESVINQGSNDSIDDGTTNGKKVNESRQRFGMKNLASSQMPFFKAA